MKNMMPRLNIPVAAVALWLSYSFAQGQGTFVYDQQSGDESATIGTASVDPISRVGQSFTPSLTAAGFIQLTVKDEFPGNALGGTLYLNLRSGSISGTVLSSSLPVSIPDNFGHTSNAFINFFFSTPVAVIPGTVYFFQPVVQSGENCLVGVNNSTFNPYSGGTAYFDGTGSAGLDLWFREGIVVPEPSITALVIFGAATIIFFASRRYR